MCSREEVWQVVEEGLRMVLVKELTVAVVDYAWVHRTWTISGSALDITTAPAGRSDIFTTRALEQDYTERGYYSQAWANWTSVCGTEVILPGEVVSISTRIPPNAFGEIMFALGVTTSAADESHVNLTNSDLLELGSFRPNKRGRDCIQVLQRGEMSDVRKHIYDPERINEVGVRQRVATEEFNPVFSDLIHVDLSYRETDGIVVVELHTKKERIGESIRLSRPKSTDKIRPFLAFYMYEPEKHYNPVGFTFCISSKW